MLIQFSVKNFKTFKDKVTLSMVASDYVKDTQEAENLIPENKFGLKLLKSAVVYGANASGKSKLLQAMDFMKFFTIYNNANNVRQIKQNLAPFRLSEETENEPSEFEMIFIHNNIMYRYGFELNREAIISEWLFYNETNEKEVEVFYRDYKKINLDEKTFSKINLVVKENLVRDDALLLSVAASFNDDICIAVFAWFVNLTTILENYEEDFGLNTFEKLKNSLYKKRILDLLNKADLDIQDIRVKENDIGFDDIFTKRKKYNISKLSIDNNSVEFSLYNDESAGTQKFFVLAGYILEVLDEGYTLVIDELDSKLHPNLVRAIVLLFNSKDLNSKNAQLIFNTHDTNLLDKNLFREDQIWFVEKNRYGEAKLYSKADFEPSENIDKVDNLEKNYLDGKYGAVPFLRNLKELENE